MAMEAGLDTGPVLLREALPIGPRDTAGTLHDRLAALGGRLIVEALAGLDGLTPEPQAEDGRQLCGEDRQGRGAGRLDPAGAGSRPADPRAGATPARGARSAASA